MIEKSEAGICNFTNPGQINLLDIINIYNETTNSQINPIINPIINNTNHLDLETNKRSFARLYSDKLTKYEPLDIKTAIKDCCKKYII
jgi:hypothetical protein